MHGLSDQDLQDLYERLRTMLDRADRGVVGTATEIEYVLTEGYAYALNLELRPQRIERRIVERVTSGRIDDDELHRLAREKLDVDRELIGLRETLARLQEHCDALTMQGRVAMSENELVHPAEPPDST